MKIKVLLLLPVALVAGLLAARPLLSEEGKEGGGEGAMPETMQPGPEHAALAKLAGKYEVSGKFWMEPGAEAVESKGTATMTSIMDGRFVQQDYEGAMMGMTYKGTAILGYDRVTKRYTEHWIDNLSTSATFLTGTSEDGGKTIVLSGKMSEPEAGVQVTTRWVHTQKSDDQFVFDMFFGEKDKEHKVMELTYTRKK
ncbi:MAG: DUF1579 domain-containing protein [Planctomycetes bacterium]|nr:DUF1579 domain-containing protein [Planctomycetota bacterium]